MQERKKARRKGRRVIGPVPNLVFWRGDSGRYEADICDIGMGGCFLNTNGNADDGESITLEIPTSTVEQSMIEFPGTVIPQGRKFKGFGVRFGALSEEQQSMIARLMVQLHEQAERRKNR
ncbi:MAG TPA: PilZ domain-containing protein [Pyrinomonadaceae bacterium]|nr:PilZ domain-containing protein [Pyrinomonadaceae bacterium]